MAVPMRVLVVAHTYVIGVNQQKLRALANTGCVEMGLLAPRTWRVRDLGQSVHLAENNDAIRVYPSRVFFSGRGGAYVYSPRTAAKAVSHFVPDVIQVEQEVFSLSSYQMALLARRRRTPLIVLCCESVDRRLSALRRYTRDVVLDTTTAIIAGNEGAADLVRKWGYKGPVEVIPQLGVDTRLFSPQCAAGDRGVFTVGFVGRLVRQKGVDVILRAIKELRDRGVRCEILLCGAGPDERAYRMVANQQNIEDLVVWHGPVKHEDVPDVMRKMDALVLASRSVPGCREQFGHVLIEAMSMGLPVVGSDCGEIPRVIDRDDLIFPQEDVLALASILERIAKDIRWRESVSKYGVARVQERFSHERVAEKYIEAWQRVIH